MVERAFGFPVSALIATFITAEGEGRMIGGGYQKHERH